MRMCIFCKKSLLVALALISGQALLAQEKVSKKIEQTYAMTHSGKLLIDNKYGDVFITGWEKNSLAITVTISVSHKKRENARKLLDRIGSDMKTTGDFVSISTEIAERSSSVFSRYFNKANPFDFDKSNVQIDYTVHLPANAELDITNKFGDVIIEDWVGKFNGDIQHGDIWINENLNNADVNVQYGKIRAKSINYGNIRLKNGSIAMDESRDLRLNSSGSTIKIEKAALLRLYSSKDDISIEELGRISGDIRFTTMFVNGVDESVELTLKVTDFIVANIYKQDVVIDLNQESSEINLNISDLAFHFDATLEQGLLRIPKSFKNVDTKMLDQGKRIREIRATYGKNPSGKISIKGKKGIIQLKEM